MIVIASGCTDDTVEQVKILQPKHHGLKLIVQEKRSGKSSAINLFLTQAKEDICVIESADTIPAKDTVEELCAPFKDKTIGMSGAHPVPTNSPNSFMGFCVHTMWEMHHQIALTNPKCGEMIAFRKVFKEIPPQSAVDEASIEAEIKKHGLKIVYAPKAIVHNKGPETTHDFIAQRRRINAGHIWLKKHHGHKISTGNNSSVLGLTLRQFGPDIKKDAWIIGMIAMEAFSRILAYKDYYLGKKKYTVWDRIASTKNPEISNRSK